MESRRNLRVVPSNAPTLGRCEIIQCSPGQSSGSQILQRTCPEFNNDVDCRVCDLVHACSTCFSEDHNSRTCKKAVRQERLENGSVQELAANLGYSDRDFDEYASKTSQVHVKAPGHPAQTVLKVERRRIRRALDTKLPLYYRAELLSEKYRSYRERSRNKGLGVWPDHVEEAFQRGIFP